jgi:hypothetical protein
MITAKQLDALRNMLPLYTLHADALAAAIATIEGLPQHADTGNRFIPGRDPAWIVPDGETEPQIARAAIGGQYGDGIGDVWVMLDIDGNMTSAQPFATAAAAKGGEDA